MNAAEIELRKDILRLQLLVVELRERIEQIERALTAKAI